MSPQQAADRIYMLRTAAKEMEDEAKGLVSEFFSGRGVDTYVEGPFKIIVGRNARFEPSLVRKALAEGVITEEEYEQMLETKPSGDKAKDIVSPAVFRTFQKESAHKVTVSLPKESD